MELIGYLLVRDLARLSDHEGCCMQLRRPADFGCRASEVATRPVAQELCLKADRLESDERVLRKSVRYKYCR